MMHLLSLQWRWLPLYVRTWRVDAGKHKWLKTKILFARVHCHSSTHLLIILIFWNSIHMHDYGISLLSLKQWLDFQSSFIKPSCSERGWKSNTHKRYFFVKIFQRVSTALQSVHDIYLRRNITAEQVRTQTDKCEGLSFSAQPLVLKQVRKVPAPPVSLLKFVLLGVAWFLMGQSPGTVWSWSHCNFEHLLFCPAKQVIPYMPGLDVDKLTEDKTELQTVLIFSQRSLLLMQSSTMYYQYPLCLQQNKLPADCCGALR